jgi:hypothetical protein
MAAACRGVVLHDAEGQGATGSSRASESPGTRPAWLLALGPATAGLRDSAAW